ncbi:MAG: hypothetical protein U0836_02390 [Pirellulales bacterium]
MNGRLVWRVMWKEYRALRGLWLAVAVASWLAQVAAILLEREFSLLEIAYGAALITPVFYVFGVAAAMFAGEREDGTDRLLRALPVPTWPLATGKILFVALSTLALIPAAGLLAVGELWWPSPGRVDPRGAAGLEFIWAPAILEGAVWGLFFSLLCRGVMQAATLAALAAAATVTIALHLTNNTAIDQVDPMQYAQSLWLRLAIVGVVVLVDWALARDWLAERTATEREAGASWRAVGRFRSRLWAWLAGVRRWQVRLTWLHFRQSAPLLTLVAAAPIVLAVVTPELADRAHYPLPTAEGIWYIDLRWEATLMVIAALVGTQVFAGDKRQRGYRCLAEQGCSAAAVWLNRQALAIAWLVGAVALWHGAWAARFAWARNGRPFSYFDSYSADSPGWEPSNVMPWREIASMAIVYAAAQVGSLLLAGGVVSTLVGLVLACAAFGWSALMIYLLLPAEWTVWPLALGMLAATAVFARGWLLDQRGFSTWLKSGLAFGLFAACTFGSIPSLRLEGLNDRAVAFDAETFRDTLDADAQQTADLYRRAVDMLRTYEDVEDELAPPNPTNGERESREDIRLRRVRSEFTELDRAWLASNQASIALVLEANQRPTSAFMGGVSSVGGRNLYALADLLLLRGQLAADLDAELAAYVDLLRMTERLRPGYGFYSDATYYERRAFESLLRWAIRPGQTADRVRQARREVEAHVQRVPGPDQAIKMKYLETLRTLEAGDQEYRFLLDYYIARLPWERTRARWMLNAWASENLPIVEEAMQQLSEHTLNRLRSNWWNEWQTLEVASTPALRAPLSEEWGLGYQLADKTLYRRTNQRATILLLELAAARLEKGALPEKLEELVNPDFLELPRDPFTDRSFEYFPSGFPASFETNLPLGSRLEETFRVGPPSVWSPGGWLVRNYRKEEDKEVLEFSTMHFGRREGIETELGGWQAGLVFPVPTPADAPKTQ